MTQNDTAKAPLTRAQARRLKKQQAAAQIKAGRDGLSDDQTAAKLGISRRTLTRWRYDPAFVAMLKQAESTAWAKWQVEFDEKMAEQKRDWYRKCEEREQREKAARRRRYLRSRA